MRLTLRRLVCLLPLLLCTRVVQAQGAVPSSPAVLLASSFGAAGDLRVVPRLSIAEGSRSVSAAAGTFAATDVGKTVASVALNSAGVPVPMVSQIVAVSADGAQATTLDQARIGLREAPGGIGTDNSTALQRCWDESAQRGLPCFLPAGQYLFAGRPLVLRTHMSIEGSSPEATQLMCAPSLHDCVELGAGPVQFVFLSRFSLSGTEAHLPPPKSGAEAQRGFHLVAHGDGNGAGGGLWQSTFEHVEVSNFWGDEFTLQGGVGEFMHPNQFLFFEDLELQAARGEPGVGPPADTYRLRLEGQNAQIAFSGGQIHGSIGSQLGNGVRIEGAGVVRFDGVTCEWLDSCLEVPSANAVRFTNGWIENVKRVATLGPGAVRGFSLDHNYVANSCYDPSTHGGWCLRLASARADAGVQFAWNTLAWSSAAPDTLVSAPPTAHVEARENTINGGGTGQKSNPAATGAESASWRKAQGETPWIPPQGSATLALVWAPSPLRSDAVTAACNVLGAAATVRVDGIVRADAKGLEVRVSNSDPGDPQRATVQCVGVP